MNYKLRSLQDPEIEIQIGVSPVRVGRSKDNHLKISDPSVSRHHAEITVEGGAPVVVDLNSTRGTFVNSERVQRRPLKAGDVIAFGTQQFQCLAMEAAPARAPVSEKPPKRIPALAWVGAVGAIVIVVALITLMRWSPGWFTPATATPIPLTPTEPPTPTLTAIPSDTPTPSATEIPNTGPITRLEDVPLAVFRIEAEKETNLPEGIETIWSGTGFVIDETGLAVTNNHVITGAALYNIYFEGDTKPITASVKGISECSDLALIQLAHRPQGYRYLQWFTDNISTGLEIREYGWPLDSENVVVTNGIVSQILTRIASSRASVNSGIEFTAQTNPGNSGSPIITSNAQVVGIAYAAKMGESVIDTVPIAITSAEAMELVDLMKTEKYVWSLGIDGEAVKYGRYTGILVYRAATGGPAYNAGIRGGDLIINIEGVTDLAEEATMAKYCDILRSRNPGDTLVVYFLRTSDNSFHETEVTLPCLGGCE